jgi:hypothetical protein
MMQSCYPLWQRQGRTTNNTEKRFSQFGQQGEYNETTNPYLKSDFNESQPMGIRPATV